MEDTSIHVDTIRVAKVSPNSSEQQNGIIPTKRVVD